MVDFDPVKLSTVPHLTVLPMTVIAIWATIDGIIAKMLSNLMNSDFAIGVAMFHAIRSQDGQRQAVRAAAEKALLSMITSCYKLCGKLLTHLVIAGTNTPTTCGAYQRTLRML